MDCKYVRESQCLCFAFHPLASSLFYLTNNKNRLRIVEENLYTGLVMNQLGVPLREQNLNVDNYILNYSPENKQLVLTLSNHVLVYSLDQKSLIFVGETQQSKNPCFIEKAVLKKGLLYFSATDHHQLFAINVADCVRAGVISNYIKFKLPPQVYARSISMGNGRLAAICDDCNLRVWESESGNALKGAVLQKIGDPSCMSFSKDGQYLLIGSSSGWIQVWDGGSLGVVNTIVLSKQIGKERIQSVTWFHYSGEAQSRRFLVLTPDGNVKLFSFYFERTKDGKEKWMGKSLELTLLYNIKGNIRDEFQIRSHQFANFIYFHPGVLLYMVDYYPRIYYPVVTTQIVHSFESLVPSNKKELYFQPNFFFLDNLQIKRLRNQVQNKVALGSVLDYQDLKILKMDYRPKFSRTQELPLTISKGSPSQKFKYKFLILYYLGNMIRSLVISNICLSGSNDSVDTLKEYSGNTVMFIGPNRNLEPLIFILQEDKQTITVLNENTMPDQSQYLQEQRQYLKQSGQIYIRQLKIKIQKVFETPFRNSYVVLYLSDNLLRFSNNIQIHSSLIDYDVYTDLGLRLDYNDIVIDVVWSCRGEIGCVVCLEKVIFVNDELKVMRSVNIQGYVIQGQFVGYTLIVTTKVDVQYVDLAGKPLQLYCIQNYESRYLIMGILADRIIGVERFNGAINCKVRYFNLMQPLLSGYLTYFAQVGAPANAQIMKTIIEGMAPYHIVSEEFLTLLNSSGFSNFSKYFIESHIKLYSRSLRAATLNTELKIQRFINPKVWLQNRGKILDYFLYYEDLKDSSDSYQMQKTKDYENKLVRLVGSQVFACITAAVQENQERQKGKVTIAANFGEQALFQIYYDYNEKENVFFKMELLPFKATDDREWIGINPLYLQSKIGQNENDVDVNAVQEQPQNQNDDKNSEEQEGDFKDLLVYYRFDDGKGDLVDDLSDFNNEGYVNLEGGDPWRQLEEQPMELQDKWGKKCPPQFSISSAIVTREKKLSGKNIKNFSFQIWCKSEQPTYRIVQIGEHFQFGFVKGQFYYKTTQIIIIKPTNSEIELLSKQWNNISFTFNKKQASITLYLNSVIYFKGKGNLKVSKDSLTIGSNEMQGQFTQFRLWRKELTPQQVKDYLRTPLDIVAQKRKRLKMKIKEKKKKSKTKGEGEGEGQFFPSFPF